MYKIRIFIFFLLIFSVEGGVRILGMAPNNRMRFLSCDIKQICVVTYLYI